MELIWSCQNWSELSLDDFHDILKLRIDIFVVEQNCPYPELDDKDKESMHLMAKDSNGNIAAYIRILPPGLSYREAAIGRVVVSVPFRGKQLGYLVMEKGMSWISDNWGEQNIRIGAQEHLERYYGKLGFIRKGEMYLEDGIPHIEMLFEPNKR